MHVEMVFAHQTLRTPFGTSLSALVVQACVIPSRIVRHWDFHKHPVSCDAYDFLQATRSHPLVQFDDNAQACFFVRAPLLRETTATRRRIATLVATLSEPAANVTARDAVLRIRVTAGHRAHLLEGHELWSVLDLQVCYGCCAGLLPLYYLKVYIAGQVLS